MGFLSAEFDTVKSEVSHLLGVFGSEVHPFEVAIAANIRHDVEVLGGDAKALVKEDIAAIWDMVKQEVSSVMVDPAYKTFSHGSKLSIAFTRLGSTVWSDVSPRIVGLAEATLHTMAMNMGSLIVSGLIAAAA